MSASATQGGHKKIETTAIKYNDLPYWAAITKISLLHATLTKTNRYRERGWLAVQLRVTKRCYVRWRSAWCFVCNRNCSEIRIVSWRLRPIFKQELVRRWDSERELYLRPHRTILQNIIRCWIFNTTQAVTPLYVLVRKALKARRLATTEYSCAPHSRAQHGHGLLPEHQSRDLLFSQIFPTIDSLPASGLTPRLYDRSVSSEHLGFYF